MTTASSTPYNLPRSTNVVEVVGREALLASPDTAFQIGVAPDGLPLLLHVRRRVDVRRPVTSALGMYGRALPTHLAEPLKALEDAVGLHTRTLGVRRVGGRPYYQANDTLHSLLGATLMARLLGAVSPMVMPEDRNEPHAAERFESSIIISQDERTPPPTPRLPGSSVASAPLPSVVSRHSDRLWISLQSDEVVVAGEASAVGPPPVLDGARPVVWESLLALRSARFAIRRVDGTVFDGSLADPRAYARALAEDALALGWSVSRVDVGWVLVELARALDRLWHTRARVHGDLKPGNVFLREDGVEPFDALDIPAGETSLGLTAGWAAPEQLMAGPVTPATDVFALSLLCASLLGAAIYGEERTLIIPARGEGRRRIRAITDPEVWIDPSFIDLPLEGRLDWRAFIMENLARDPGRRDARGSAFADRLSTLLERWAPPGRLNVSCGPGTMVDVHGIQTLRAWVLSDVVRS